MHNLPDLAGKNYSNIFVYLQHSITLALKFGMYFKDNEASYYYKYIAWRSVHISERNQKFADNA